MARTLQLDDAERRYLFDLARAASAGSAPRRRHRPSGTLKPAVQQLLDGMTGIPAFVRNGRLDVLAMNDLARELYHPGRDAPDPQNFARYLLLDAESAAALDNWDAMADDTVAILRQEVGRDPHNRELLALVGELSTRSERFGHMWASHNVRFHRAGLKHFHHPAVGDLELSFQAMELPGTDNLTLIAYSAPVGSPSHDALALLSSVIATARRTAASETTSHSRSTD